MTQQAASNSSVEQGTALYTAFTNSAPTRVMRMRVRRVMPPVVVELGDLVGLIYRSDKGGDHQARAYLHLMEDPPYLVSNVEGNQLYIVGGNYRVTPRGIEG